MKRLLPHDERRTRHGFGMLGFPLGKEKGGRLGHDESGGGGGVVQSVTASQLGRQPTGSLYITKRQLMGLIHSERNLGRYPIDTHNRISIDLIMTGRPLLQLSHCDP